VARLIHLNGPSRVVKSTSWSSRPLSSSVVHFTRPGGPHTAAVRGPLLVEEARHVFRDLLTARVHRLHANLGKRVAHVLNQDKLSVITRRFELSEELNRLRLEHFRVVDTLNQKDGRRVRRNEVRRGNLNCGASR
jgi:hypothetical protein